MAADRIAGSRSHAAAHIHGITKTKIDNRSGSKRSDCRTAVFVPEGRGIFCVFRNWRIVSKDTGSASRHCPGCREWALVSIAERKTKFLFGSSKMTGCGAEDMCTVTGCDGHGSERKGLTDRGAGTIQPIKRNPHISNAKRRCDRLCKKIPGKCHSDIRRLKTGFSDRQYSSFFLESAFGVFPGICPEAWIFAHHIKTVSERPFAFFFADDRSRTLNIDRLLKSETCFSGLNCWFHPTTSISLRI